MDVDLKKTCLRHIAGASFCLQIPCLGLKYHSYRGSESRRDDHEQNKKITPKATLYNLAERAEVADTLPFPCFFPFYFFPATGTSGDLINIQMFS
jgi:hypothetical protein